MTSSRSGIKLLRWAGSKSQSAAAIAPFLDFEKNYVEAFCGSASFFFTNGPSKAFLNDTNSNLINFYRDLVDTPSQVWSLYNSYSVDRDSYYEIRTKYNQARSSVEKSAFFLYLNHYCFNGIYRTNNSGFFNTPFGKHGKNKKKLPWENFQSFSEIAKSASFSCLDFEDFLISSNIEESCIYLDPPYFTKDDRVFREYGTNSFKSDDLKRLFKVFEKISQDNLVVVTYKDCSEFRAMFSKYIVSEVSITRNIGGFAGRRKRDTELVAIAHPT